MTSAKESGLATVQTQPPAAMRVRYRVRFAKEGSLRFLGHHDLMRHWERLLRRAGLPLSHSEGFHPKPRLSLPLALALGIIGREEILEFELREPFEPQSLIERMTSAGLCGLRLLSVEQLPPGVKARVRSVEYRCPIPDGADTSALADRARHLLAEPAILVVRQLPNHPAKTIDLRPGVDSIQIDGHEIVLRFWILPSGSPRPEEVLRLLGVPDHAEAGLVLERSRVVLVPEVSPLANTPTREEKENIP